MGIAHRGSASHPSIGGELLASAPSASITHQESITRFQGSVTFGRPLFHPVVDLLLLCGAFSVPLLWLSSPTGDTTGIHPSSMLMIFIIFNYAHFASSTLRLYTKPAASTEHRFLVYGFPVVALLTILGAVALPEVIGRVLIALYLTWSPYHYAGQAYGLTLMYTHRSGMLLSAGEKTCLRWICLLPFLRAVINPNDTSVVEVMGVRGLPWLFPDTLFGNSVVVDLLSGLVALMTPLIFVLPVAFAFYRRTRLPLLGLVLVLINSLWLVGFTYFEGAVWATVAHSIQYLMIVSYAHAQDSARSSTSPIRPGLHGAVFYLVSIVLGVPLFVGLPVVVQTLGGWLGQPWSMVHCVTMTVVAINLHHFIVDGSIWRSKRGRVPASTPASSA